MLFLTYPSPFMQALNYKCLDYKCFWLQVKSYILKLTQTVIESMCEISV